MSSEERCPTCGSRNKTARGRLSRGKGAFPNSGMYSCPDPWHSPAPVDAERPISVESLIARLTVKCDKAPAPAEGAEPSQHARWKSATRLLLEYIEDHGWGTIPEPHDSIRPIYELLEESDHVASLREQLAQAQTENDRLTDAFLVYETIQPDGSLRATLKDVLKGLAQAQFEVEALKGNVKDWRKAYEDAQRESAHFEELMHAAVEDYGNAKRELEEARAALRKIIESADNGNEPGQTWMSVAGGLIDEAREQFNRS